MRFFQSRPFPDGFLLRSVTVRRKTDGWFVSVRLQDDSVPAPLAHNEIRTAIGVDLGITKLASLSTGETMPNPRFGQKVERKRKILQRRASRKQKGSKKRRKVYQHLGQLENKFANKRSDYQWKLGNEVVRQADLIVFEDLNIKGMSARCKPKQDENGKYIRNGASAKAGLNKAILDASWGEFKQKVRAVSEKAGVIFLEVNPRHTSQECSQCGFISPTNRDKERFLCESCGYFCDADVQAALNIRERGLKELGINLPQLPVVHGKVRTLAPRRVPRRSKVSGTPKNRPEMVGTSMGLPVESGKPLIFVQLSLFDLLESREGG